MKRVVDNPVSPGGDIDALLGAFFKGEMPGRWPAFQPPPRRRALPFRGARPRPRFALGSRLALVAAMLLLMLSGWLLSGKFPGPAVHPDIPGLSDPKANSKDRLPPQFHLVPDDPAPESKPGPGKVKSNFILEQGAEGTGIRIDVEEVPSGK